MSLYSNRVTKFLSVKCPWCWGRSLSCTVYVVEEVLAKHLKLVAHSEIKLKKTLKETETVLGLFH